jgi:hypothetical protein
MIQLIAAIKVLERYYTIHFISGLDLRNNALYAATSVINKSDMHDVLEKTHDQEEQYCQITIQKIKSAMMDPRVTLDEVLAVIRKIPNLEQVRMVQLKGLKKFDTRYKNDFNDTEEISGYNKGGFIF